MTSARTEAIDITESKWCTGCGEVKPLTAFSPHAKCADGRQSRCKSCRAAAAAASRAADPAGYREKVRRWNEAKDPGVQRALKRRHSARVRVQVFDHYGWACACCGTTEGRLTIDHIDGNGRAHRIELFGAPNSAGMPFYAWLVRNGFPGGFQTLCSRCNNAKGASPACPLHAPLAALGEAA